MEGAGMNISSFFRLMLPYSLISLALLLLWIWLPFLMQRESAEERQDNTESWKVWKPEETSGGWMATDNKSTDGMGDAVRDEPSGSWPYSGLADTVCAGTFVWT